MLKGIMIENIPLYYGWIQMGEGLIPKNKSSKYVLATQKNH